MPSPKKSNTKRARAHLQSRPLQSRPLINSPPFTYSVPPSANPNDYSRRMLLPLPEGPDIDIGFGYKGFNYDSKPVQRLNEAKDFDDVGPKMQVFSTDMPNKWRQCLMGFTDNWKVTRVDGRLWGYDDGDSGDNDDEVKGSRSGLGGQKKKEVQQEKKEKKEKKPKEPHEVPCAFLPNYPKEAEGGGEVGGEKQPIFAKEEYVRMWMTCDGELYMTRLGTVLTKIEKFPDELEKRETRFVRAGAAKKKVDDMLEYSVRLATGARVPQDEDAALRTLSKVVQGPYPKDKTAVAHNQLCYLYKKRFGRRAVLENLICVLIFADLALSSGPFTHYILMTSVFLAPPKDFGTLQGFSSAVDKI